MSTSCDCLDWLQTAPVLSYRIDKNMGVRFAIFFSTGSIWPRVHNPSPTFMKTNSYHWATGVKNGLETRNLTLCCPNSIISLEVPGRQSYQLQYRTFFSLIRISFATYFLFYILVVHHRWIFPIFRKQWILVSYL